MIGPEDIEAFQEAHGEALSQMHEFRRRSMKGIPVDRWATERQMHLVADGIGAALQIMEWQNNMLLALVDADGDAGKCPAR